MSPRLNGIRLLIIACVLVSASPTLATPTVGIHWGSCPYPQSELTNRNPDGSTHQTITVTARGLSGVVRAVEVWAKLNAQESGIGDAWRFDENGCNHGHLAYNQVPLSDPCPLLTGPNEQTFTGEQYVAWTDSYGAVGASESWADARSFDGVIANPDVTYTIARFDVDLGTSCGCAERRMCIMLTRSSYIDGDGLEHAFSVGSEFLNWNDPANSLSCPNAVTCLPPGCEPIGADTTCVGNPTPAHRASWGQVKANYR